MVSDNAITLCEIVFVLRENSFSHNGKSCQPLVPLIDFSVDVSEIEKIALWIEWVTQAIACWCTSIHIRNWSTYKLLCVMISSFFFYLYIPKPRTYAVVFIFCYFDRNRNTNSFKPNAKRKKIKRKIIQWILPIRT